MTLPARLVTDQAVWTQDAEPDDPLSPISKDALVDKIRALLQEAIVTGRFPQGQRINETVVAARLGISRGPIREALAGLSNQGVVVKVANKGFFVTELTPSDVEELYALRSMYEVFALRHLMTHARSVPLALLDEIIREIGESVTREDAERATSAVDLRFHTELIRAAGLPRLLAAWSALMPQLQMLFYSRNAANPDFRRDIVGNHRQIMDALQGGDCDVAERLLREHIDASRRELAADWEG